MNSPEIHPITAHTVVPFPCWCYYEPDRRWDFINLKAMSSMYDTHYCTSDTMPTTAPLSEPTVKESLSVETPPPEGEPTDSQMLDWLGIEIRKSIGSGSVECSIDCAVFTGTPIRAAIASAMRQREGKK